MRLISENKALRTAPPAATCLGQHKLHLGQPCPSCGTAIPFGPYSFEEHARLFGGPVNAPPIREPRPEYTEAHLGYLAAARARELAYGEVVRLETELARAQMETTTTGWTGQTRAQAPDAGNVARLTAQLAAAREAVPVADAQTAKALGKLNKAKA